MSNNNINTPATSQAPTQAQDWALIPTYDTIEYGEMYETPTGHYVEVKTMHYPCYTNLTIKVSNEDGSVIACTAHFGGVDQEECYEAFYKGYMESSSLQRIYDERCISANTPSHPILNNFAQPHRFFGGAAFFMS